MRYTIKFKGSAKKIFSILPGKIQQKIATKIDALGDNPRPYGSVKLTAKPNLYRIRIGDIRIVYTINDNELLVLVITIGQRKDVYRKL